MPKRPSDSRPTFSSDLREELLAISAARGRPETEISPLLEALAREWIQTGSFRSREEELASITARLAAVEDQLRKLVDRLSEVPSKASTSGRETHRKLDNLARRVFDHLRSIANETGITERVSADGIRECLCEPGAGPTEKQVRGRISKLITLKLISIEEDSGGGGGRRYRIEQDE